MLPVPPPCSNIGATLRNPAEPGGGRSPAHEVSVIAPSSPIAAVTAAYGRKIKRQSN